MMKIYTADRYMGKPYCRCSVIVADEYIYSADRFTRNLTGNPDTTKAIGRIDYEKGVIYNTGTMFSKIIAEFEQKSGEIRVYKVPRTIADTPILSIENDKLYAGSAVAFSQPRGYIQYSDYTADAEGKATDFGELYYAIFGVAEPKDSNDSCLGRILSAFCAVALLAAVIGLICTLIYEGAKSFGSAMFYLLTTMPIILVAVVMMVVLSVNLKKTFKRVNVSAAVKQQCRRASLPVALKAMIVPVAAALLSMVLTGETAALMMSVPFLIMLFVYCWVVVCRMMQAGLLDRQRKSHGGTMQNPFAPAWKKLLQKCKRLKKGNGGHQRANGGTAAVERVLRPCPHCAAKCRVPAGRGRMTITCPLCHTKYQVRT